MLIRQIISLIICAAVLVPMAHAQPSTETISAANLAELQQSQRLAQRVYQATQDIQGAVAVLEEQGITKLSELPAEQWSDNVHIELLEYYANLIAQLPTRRLEATRLLVELIKTAPERSAAYLSLGDMYYRLYQTEPNARHQTFYQRAYRKYLALLRQQPLTPGLLSPRILDAYYPTTGSVCDAVLEFMHTNSTDDISRFFNPETNFKTITSDTDSPAWQILRETGLVQGSVSRLEQSTIDVDNDGQREVRYSTHINDGCQRNLFYKQYSGQWALLSNALLKQYYQTGHLCGTDRLLFMRYQQQNYLLQQRTIADNTQQWSVFALNPTAEAEALCTLQPPTAEDTPEPLTPAL